jgi:acyl-CoA synthetase (AMP-forming)/AMP-acid ligase II
MSLLASLSGLDPSRLALRFVDRDLTYGQLCTRAADLSADLAGARLALHSDDLEQAVVLLTAADGRAESVLLTSPGLPAEVVNPLIALIEPQGVLTPEPEGAAPAPRMPWHRAGQAASLAALLAPLQARQPESGSRTGADGERATAWILTTSGTTGTPKLVAHGLASLTRTTRTDPTRSAGQVWGLLYDYTRFAGLQVLLQSLLSGACLAVADPKAPLAAQLAFLAASGVTHLSATPTLWRKILMTPGAEDLPLRQITLGGEIADEAILQSLSRHFPKARLSHIFASTEAGVGFSVTDRQAGFPAQYLTEPPSGIGLRIIEGRLQVRNDQVRPDYLGGQGALARDGWVDTGDAVDQIGDRVLFKGRANGVINVGGNKVHPEEVERALLSHPDVVMARVYAKSNPITGALVMADVVAGPTAPESLSRDLQTYLRPRLERHMIPARIRITEPFDINVAGKIKRGG